MSLNKFIQIDNEFSQEQKSNLDYQAQLNSKINQMIEIDSQTCFYQDSQNQLETKARSLLQHQSDILEDMIAKNKKEKVVYKMRPSKIISQKCYRIVDLRQQRIKVLQSNPSTKESNQNEQLNSDPQRSKKTFNRDKLQTPAQFNQGGLFGNNIQTERRTLSRVGINTNNTVFSPKSIQFIATNIPNDSNLLQDQQIFQKDQPKFMNQNMFQTKSNFIFSEKHMKNFQNKRLSLIKDKSRQKNKGSSSQNQNQNYQIIQQQNNIDQYNSLQQGQNQKQPLSNTLRSRSQCFLEFGSQYFQEFENQQYQQNENQFDLFTNGYNYEHENINPLNSEDQIDQKIFEGENQNLNYNVNNKNFVSLQKQMNIQQDYIDNNNNKQLKRSNSMIKENQKQFMQYLAKQYNCRSQINFNNKYSTNSQRNAVQQYNIKSNTQQEFSITNQSNKFISEANTNGKQSQQQYSIQMQQNNKKPFQKSENLIQNNSDFVEQNTQQQPPPVFNQSLYFNIQNSYINSDKYCQNSLIQANSKSIEQDTISPAIINRQFCNVDNQLFEKLLQEYSQRNEIFSSVFQNKSQMIKSFQNKTQLIYDLQNKNQMVKNFQTKSQLVNNTINKTQKTSNSSNKSQIVRNCTSEGNRNHRKASSNNSINKENNSLSKCVENSQQNQLIQDKQLQNANFLELRPQTTSNIFSSNKNQLEQDQNSNLVLQFLKKIQKKPQIQNKYENNYFEYDNIIKENNQIEKNMIEKSSIIMNPEENGVKIKNPKNDIKQDTSVNMNKFIKEESKLNAIQQNSKVLRPHIIKNDSKEKSIEQIDLQSQNTLQRSNKLDEEKKNDSQKKYIDNLILQMFKKSDIQNEKQQKLQNYLCISINENQVRNKMLDKIIQQQLQQKSNQQLDLNKLVIKSDGYVPLLQQTLTESQNQEFQNGNQFSQYQIFKQIQQNKENNLQKIKNIKDDEQYQQLNEYYNSKYKNIQHPPDNKNQYTSINIKHNNQNENLNDIEQRKKVIPNIIDNDKFEPWEQNDQNHNLIIDDYDN